MKLYNTLSRQLETVTPLQPPAATVYTCGPTVYDYAHIGHWFNYVRMDMLIRTLRLSGYQPQWVMNITDVGHLVSDADEGEDKLEKGARREGKTAWEVADFYTQDFLTCMELLHIGPVSHLTKATDHIAEQIALIERLEAKGFTYKIDDGVYYDTTKFPNYASFARLDLDDLQAGARVDYNHQKRSPSDFALWKFSPTDHQRDMEWDSPWGKGFPGWHIECSAMAMKYLGETLDIHAGGIDHIPVHHTNEIAQSEAATGKRFAELWLHSNHVTVNGEKISKSLGNGIRLQDIVARGVSPEVVRLHILESHYRSQSKFSWESLEAAKNRYQAYQAMADRRWQQARDSPHALDQPALEDMQSEIKNALEDDLDTPQALSSLSSLETAIATYGYAPAAHDVFVHLLEWLDEALGLQLSHTKNISEAQAALVAQREEARASQHWDTADSLRRELEDQGIGLRDTAQGAVWFRL